MFDIGFWELVVVAVVALLVVGPERLPALVRDVAGWTQRLRRMATAVRSEFENEFHKAEELKSLIEREAQIAALHAQVDDNSTSVPARVRAPAPAANDTATPPATAAPEVTPAPTHDGTAR